MFSTVLLHDIQRYLAERTFQIAVTIMTVLVLVVTFTGAEDYAVRRRDYLDAVRELGWNPETKEMNVFREPQVLSILALGKDSTYGVRMSVHQMSVKPGADGYMERSYGITGQGRDSSRGIDIAFVLRIFFSLLVVFIAHSAVSREKETGTLRQVIANKLLRSTFILGKFTAGALMIMVISTLAGAAAFLVMIFHPQVPVNGEAALRVLLMFGAATIYGLVFYTLSIAVSTIVDRSSSGLILLLTLWILFVLVVPNLGVVTAERFKQVSRETYDERARAIQTEEREKIRALNPIDSNEKALLRDTYFHESAAESYRQAVVPYDLAKRRQAEFAQRIAFISPAVLFDRITTRLARTDSVEFERFTSQFFTYWETISVPEYWWHIPDDPPRFIYIASTLGGALVSRAPELLILLFYTVIAFTTAYTAFIRKDVR